MKIRHDLVLAAADKQLVQYKQMCSAIAVCHKFDECKGIIDRSVALSAYYAQIKDIETELMFNRVRLRAWRRISELLSPVDLTDCETQIAKVKKIRAAFPEDAVVADMSDSRIVEVVRLATLSETDFEYAVNQRVNGSLADFFRRTPEFEAMCERNRKEQDERVKAAKEKIETKEEKTAREDREKREEGQKRQEELELEQIVELRQSADAAMKEVGITLDRRDRANIKQVVFLIKANVHAVMRQAAFDKKITMQEVLRRGLKLWLEANGYEFPDEPKQRKRASSEHGASL